MACILRAIFYDYTYRSHLAAGNLSESLYAGFSQREKHGNLTGYKICRAGRIPFDWATCIYLVRTFFLSFIGYRPFALCKSASQYALF
jgi:hypothetical protein